MNLNLLYQIPLIEISLLTSIVLLHFVRAVFNSAHGVFSGFIFVVIVTILFLVPFGLIGAPWNLPLAAYIRGVIGDLSITTMMLILFTWNGLGAFRIASGTPILIAVSAIFLYPFALGLTMFDPYAWGYQSMIFVGAVLVIAAIYFFSRNSWETLIVALAVIAWSIHWHESANLWDYLLDPFLAVWAVVISIRWIIWGRPEPYSNSDWSIDASAMSRRKGGRMFG